MAAALANHAVSFAPRPFSTQAQSSRKQLKTLTLSLPLRQNPNPKPTNSGLLFSVSCRRSLVPAAKVAQTNPTTINGDQESKINVQDLPSMKILIESYKKALLESDESSLSQIEASICALEMERNNLSTKLTDIKTEISSGKEQFLRLNADFENFRKQIEKDRSKFTSDIQVEVAESLLPIIDSFEKAKLEMILETEKERKIGTSYQGIYKQFVEILRNLGVSVVETVGKPFDPMVHEAVAREESDQFKAGTVSLEIRRGFLLKNRILRPATVKVSAGPTQAKTGPDSSEKSVEQSDTVENSTPPTNDS